MKRLPSLALLLGCQLANAQTATLTVNLQGIKDAPGNLRASLYLAPETFRKEDKAVQIVSQTAIAGDSKLLFKNIPPGRYAVMVYHDENADEHLNLRFGMFPTEGYGLSNNPAVFGPPKFADSAFEVSAPESAIDIKLGY